MLRSSVGILLAIATGSAILLVAQGARHAKGTPVGLFESDTDIGGVLHPGAVEYDPAKNSYIVTAGGDNISFTSDAFHFAWKTVSGSVRLSADISFLGSAGNEHRKAVLMVRENLAADSAYVGVALRGNGLTSLEYRDENGSTVHEIQTNISTPKRVSIEKRGDFVYIALGNDDKTLRFSGASIRVPLPGSFYVGIGVSSHNKDIAEKAVFTDVELTSNLPTVKNPTLYSSLERINIASADRQIVYFAPERFEAPNWRREGTTLLFNRNGNMYRLPAAGGEPALIDTGFANRCNNDHGISPDQTLFAISDQSQDDHKSIVYIVPIGGGTPRRITQNSP